MLQLNFRFKVPIKWNFHFQKIIKCQIHASKFILLFDSFFWHVPSQIEKKKMKNCKSSVAFFIARDDRNSFTLKTRQFNYFRIEKLRWFMKFYFTFTVLTLKLTLIILKLKLIIFLDKKMQNASIKIVLG